MSPTVLRDQLVTFFDKGELRSLCFDLDINYDNLHGDTLHDKATSLVAHCQRHSRQSGLSARCRILRPQIDWPDLGAKESVIDESNVLENEKEKLSLHENILIGKPHDKIDIVKFGLLVAFVIVPVILVIMVANMYFSLQTQREMLLIPIQATQTAEAKIQRVPSDAASVSLFEMGTTQTTITQSTQSSRASIPVEVPTTTSPTAKDDSSHQSNIMAGVVVTPTSQPLISDFIACTHPCNTNNRATVFPEGTARIYTQWDYKNIPTGSRYVRSWSMNGREWVTYDCIWPGPEEGRSSATLSEPDGLHSGMWEMVISVNGQELLREQVYVQGNHRYWYYVGKLDRCFGTVPNYGGAP